MVKYVIKRILYIVPVLLLVSIIVFSLMHIIPGDPITIMLGIRAQPETVEALRSQLNLDKPIVVQYLLWIKDVLRGDLGVSIRNKIPVLELIIQRLPVTLSLAIISLSISVIISFALGILAATRRNTLSDFGAMTFAVIGVSIPQFWMGIMLILLFSLVLGIFPSMGYVSFIEEPIECIRHLILPSLALVFSLAGYTTRMTRSQMLEVLSDDYIRTARAKGLREAVVTYKHALRNALIPIVTVIGIQFAYLLGGTVLIEHIFALPGIGRLVLQSIYNRDYPVVQGVVLVVAVVFVIMNLIVDLMYRFLNPKVRYK